MRIAQYLSDSPWGDVTPWTLREKGMGGRETALVQLSEQWAKQGHHVTNLVPIESDSHATYPAGGGSAHYVDSSITSDYLTNFYSDVLVSWEEPRVFLSPEIRDHVDLNVVEMQVAHLNVFLHDHGVNCDDFIDRYAVLSPWARDFLVENDPLITKSKISILPNGIDISRYEHRSDDAPEPPFRFFYSSSPDRGLHHLLRIWPRIRERWGDAELFVAYGADKWINMVKWQHNMQSETALAVRDGLNQPGINYLGKIGQQELAGIQQSCHGLLYTCDTLQPTETGCITAIEAMAAGAVPFITDCDCLGSEFKNKAVITPLPFDDDAYLDNLFRTMEQPAYYKSIQQAGAAFAATRDWSKIAQRWIEWFETQ